MYKIRFILSLIIAISTISVPTYASEMDIDIEYTLEDPLPLDIEEEYTEEISLEEEKIPATIEKIENNNTTKNEKKSNNVISNLIEKAKEKSSSLVSAVEEKTEINDAYSHLDLLTKILHNILLQTMDPFFYLSF